MNSRCVALLLFSSMVLAACGQDDEVQNRHPNQSVAQEKGGVDTTTQSNDAKSKTDAAEKKAPTVPPAPPPLANGSKEDAPLPPKAGDVPTLPPDPAAVDGKAFFTATVLAAFKTAGCDFCHADPRKNPPTPGPLTIFNYDGMLVKLEQNILIDKIHNVTLHGGGDQCSSGIDKSPCKEVLLWWDAEFGDDPDKGGQMPDVQKGLIRAVSDTGTLTGWAFDPGSPDEQVGIRVYLGGDVTTGTMVVAGTASLLGFDNNLPGNHAFQLVIPDANIDNKVKTAYVYAMIDDKEVELTGSPITFTAYKKSTAGRNFYAATVLPRLNACTSCHTFNYDTHWATLLQPTKALGGTNTNNGLIKKLSGVVPHAGGVFCAGGNGNPCNQIKAWWDLEFP